MPMSLVQASAFETGFNKLSIPAGYNQPQYVLTPKQIERFNKQHGHLRNDLYLSQYRGYARKYGYREPDVSIN